MWVRDFILSDTLLFYVVVLAGYSLVPINFFLGWLFDQCWGDPNRYHPIILFGRLIAWGESRFNRGVFRRVKGGVYNGFILLLPAITYILLCTGGLYGVFYWGLECSVASYWGGLCFFILLNNLVVFYMLSGTTLVREVRAVFDAVERSLPEGRAQVARIVGRDTESLSCNEVRTAALETLSENLSDGVVAPLFWYFLLSVPGLLTYKMCNTQDSMIGYKNERYREYGCFSAKLDDMLNYIPARLTAFLMLLVSNRLDLIPFVYRYGRAHASPNSGYPEAALAGILNCRFGGAHDYFGMVVYKPYIGYNDRELTYEDMLYAVRINKRVECVMGVFVALLHLLLFIGFVYSVDLCI